MSGGRFELPLLRDALFVMTSLNVGRYNIQEHMFLPNPISSSKQPWKP